MPSDEARFLTNIVRVGTCLLWIGPKNRQGYGQLSAGGRNTLAHRYSYERSVGVIPHKHHIDHACHTKDCVEPLHLRPVTNKQNAENRKGLNANNSSGHPNVYRDNKTNRWFVKVQHHGKQHYGGYFAIEDVDKAGEAAVELKNTLFSHNDRDRTAA